MGRRSEASDGPYAAERNRLIVQRINLEFARIGADAVRDALVEYSDPTVAASALGGYGRLIMAVVDPDVEIDLTAQPGTAAGGGRRRGLDGWWEVWRAWLEPFHDSVVEMTDLAAIRDQVTFEVEGVGERTESERPVRWRHTQVWTLREGRVVALRIFTNRAEALRAIGEA
jgi:ketosteroid isomerase-like protein